LLGHNAITPFSHPILSKLTLPEILKFRSTSREAKNTVDKGLTILDFSQMHTINFAHVDGLVDLCSELENIREVNFTTSGIPFPADAMIRILTALNTDSAGAHRNILASFTVSKAGFTPPQITALMGALPHSLTTLELGGNSIGAAGVTVLASALPAALTTLDLSNNRIGDAGATALAGALPVTLTTLGLGDNNIGDDGATALAGALRSLPALTMLDLSENFFIGAAGATALAAALPSLTALTELRLAGNAIGDAGATTLAAALPSLSALAVLYLGSNSIGAAGITAIARALPAALTTLDLSNNRIGDDGATALARALPDLTALTSLGLSQNSIRSVKLRAIRAAAPAGCRVDF